MEEKERLIEMVDVGGVEFVKDPVLEKQLENEFVSDVKGGRIYYSKDFYAALYRKIESGMTYEQAYEALGFDLDILGRDRANSAGKRAVQMHKEGKLNRIDPSTYDGSVPREMMGEMSPEEELAYLRARTHYLETLQEAKKKFLSEYAASRSSLNRKKHK